MSDIIEIPAGIDGRVSHNGIKRVAAYCRVSSNTDEQASSLELQKRYFSDRINNTPAWENVGVFAECASGLRENNRSEFLKMMKSAKHRKVDLILTKSISRFGCNTLEMLRALQKLTAWGVDVYFEVENLWLHERKMQVVMTAYFALAQAESEGKSNNIKWGVRQGFRKGTSGYADFACFGYKVGENGRLTVDEPDAVIVRQIFEMRANGASLGSISAWLYERHRPSPTGRAQWSRETISKLLKNEKHLGDVVLQKTFVRELFSGKQMKNTG